MPTPERVLWSVEHLRFAIGMQTLFKDAEFSIHDGERVALIGRNGSGKSTLLRIIAGTETPSSGDICAARGLYVSFMPQSPVPEHLEQTAAETVREGFARFTEARERCLQCRPDSEEYARLDHFLTQHGMWEPENKLEALFSKLNLPPPDRVCAGLSGGEMRRVMFARAIAPEPDLLLLDEPTNHLDVETVTAIENFLAGYRGACLFVTHDRCFLDRIATRIVELDLGSFYSNEGSYADFLAAKEAREYAEDRAEYKRNAFLRREIDWVRRAPKARLRRNLGRIKRYEEIASIKPPERIGKMELVIPEATRLGNKVVSLKNVSMTRGGKCLFKDFSFEFQQGQRVGIVGCNGAGKTTLLKVITGSLQPDSGEVEIAPTVQFNYIDQTRVRLNPENTVRQEIAPDSDSVQFGGETIGVFGYLKRFLFEDERINTQIKLLSGGERARLALAKILRGNGNFIILDEPANDLDIPTLRVLEESLLSYTGCLCIVSHDRYFLNRVCTHTIFIKGNGETYADVGDYDSCEARYMQNAPVRKEEKKKAEVSKDSKAPKKQEKLSFKEERELEKLESEIPQTEEEIQKIEQIFSDPGFYVKHGSETAEMQSQLDQLKSELEKLYARWEELESKKESFKK